MHQGQHELAMVTQTSGALDAVPMACALGTEHNLQLQINVPLKSLIKLYMT